MTEDELFDSIKQIIWYCMGGRVVEVEQDINKEVVDIIKLIKQLIKEGRGDEDR